jgi:hypothetical protein
VILMAVYAAFVWYLAIRYRRQWAGYASVVVGVLLLLVLARGAVGEHALAASLPAWLLKGYRHLVLMLVPEAALVGLIGFFVASLPRKESVTACRGCGYELRGLDPAGLKCPECGRAWMGRGSGLEEPPIVLTPIRKGPVQRRVNI